MSPTSSRSSSATARRRRPGSCSTSTTRVGPWSPRDRVNAPSSTSTASTSTACGPRWNRPRRWTGRTEVARHRFNRDRQGRFRVGLEGPEQQLLAMLPRQVQELLEQDDPSTTRVFPVAYADDAKAEADYREMMGAQLLQQHQRCLDTLAATAAATTIDESEIHEWLDALEVLRLVLGTQLDVSEDGIVIEDADPGAAQFTVYHYLSMLQGEIVDALAAALPDGGTAPTGGGR